MGCGGCGHGENSNVNAYPDEAFAFYQNAYYTQNKEIADIRVKVQMGVAIADEIAQACKPALATWHYAFDVYTTSGATSYKKADGSVLNAQNVGGLL